MNEEYKKNNEAVHIDNLSVCYGQTPALTGVCLNVAEREYLGIIGPNGGGKSTLIKAILGLVPVTSGIVHIYGNSPEKNKTLIGYVPQITALNKKFPITLLEVVLTGRLKRGLPLFFRYTKKDEEAAFKLLDKVGIAELANRQVSQLSGGEFQKMLIARALAVNPKILFLDEPTASIDARSCEQIYKLLETLNKDMAIILVTHDLLAVSSQVQKLACLNRRLIYYGKPKLSPEIINSLYGCPVDFIAQSVPYGALREHKEGKKG